MSKVTEKMVDLFVTKRVSEALSYGTISHKRLAEMIEESLPEASDVQDLSWSIECEIWRYISGNADGTMFKCLKDNQATRKLFAELKR